MPQNFDLGGISWEPQLMQNCSSFATVGFLLLHPEMKPQQKLTAIAPNKIATRYSMEAAIMTHSSRSFNDFSAFRVVFFSLNFIQSHCFLLTK